MKFAENSFDACWKHIQSRAREDQLSEAWVPTHAGRRGNQVIGVTDDAIRIRSHRPSGQGWRDIPRREFLRAWRVMVGEIGQAAAPNQATGALIVRYFEDMHWQPDRPTIYSDSDLDPTSESDGPVASDAGPSPYERPPQDAQACEGRHRAIHAALEAALDEREGWVPVTLPPGSTLIPDKLIFVEQPGAGVFFEIKSRGSMADLYEAIGQLRIYEHLYSFEGEEPFIVVVMPDPPDNPDVLEALNASGVHLLEAVFEDDEWTIPELPAWLDEFLEPDE